MNYLRIYETSKTSSGKTSLFAVSNAASSIILGYIKWYGAWRKYVFYPGEQTLFDVNCLKEVADFLEQATDKHHLNLKDKV